MQFKHIQLDNGLNVVAEVNPQAASMALGFFAKTGSRDETPEISGVSHFLEHMMFKGTSRRSAMQVNLDFDALGARYNAYTSEENTVYYGAVLPEYQTRLLDVLGDILRPALRQEDFDMEKNVIIDEIALYDDMPKFRVYENLLKEHFSPHPLGNSVLGTRESIRGLQREQMLAYFERRYSPGNLCLIAVGNVDWPALVEKATQMCSQWKPCDVSRETPASKANERTLVVRDDKVLREHIGMMSPAPSHQDERHHAAEVMAAILGDVRGSRLYYALIETALADEAAVEFSAMDGTGALITFISADEDKAADALRIAREQIEKFRDEGPTEAEMTAAQNKMACTATLKGELPMGRLASVGYDWVYRGKYIPLQEKLDALFAVTGDDVRALAQEFDPTQATVYALGPLETL